MESCAELIDSLLQTRDSRGGYLNGLVDEENENIFSQTQYERAMGIVRRVPTPSLLSSLFRFGPGYLGKSSTLKPFVPGHFAALDMHHQGFPDQ